MLARASAWIRRERPSWRSGDIARIVLAVAAVSALPVVIWKMHSFGLLATGPASSRLANLPDGPVAASLVDWLVQDGFSPAVWATIVPLLLLVPATWLLLRRQTSLPDRILLGIALGPVVVAAALACRYLGWWGPCDALLLALAIATVVALDESRSAVARYAGPGLMLLVCLPGAVQLLPDPGSAAALGDGI